MSGTVYTGVESLWDGLGDVWTCETTLASAYMLHRLSMLIWCVAIEHQGSSSIEVYLHWLSD